MAESILFLTGHLARPRLEAVLEGMKASFAWKVLDIGVKVAALMTEEIIARRLPKPVEADKIMLPGRCRADLDRLSQRFGVPFVRGPDELKDIPGFFGRAAKASDMTKYDIQIFAEIVDASALPIEAILTRAEDYVRKGANVIDLGGLRAIARVPVDPTSRRYLTPLRHDAARLAEQLAPADTAILLGSIATPKYLEPLRPILGPKLRVPREFIGLGDMSRGSLMLRHAAEGRELTYVERA